MGISFGEYLPSSADRRQAEARGKGGHGCGAELPAELPAGGLEGWRPRTAAGSAAGRRAWRRGTRARPGRRGAGCGSARARSAAVRSPPSCSPPSCRTWSCRARRLSTALGTGAGTAARPRRSSRGSSPCPGRAAPGRTRASAVSSSSQSDGACAWVRWSGARPSRTRAARGAGLAGTGRRTMPSTVIAAKVENETLMGPSSSTRATHPDRAYPYCGYQSRAALWVSSIKTKCSPWYPRSRSL